MSDLDHFRTFVADRDVPCPSCGYSLRNLTETRCPECGESLTLGVTLSEPHIGRFIAIWIPLLTTLGFGVVVSVWSLIDDIGLEVVLPLLVLVVAGVPSAVAAIWFRRRLRRLSTFRFLVLLAGAWILPTFLIVWFFQDLY